MNMNDNDQSKQITLQETIEHTKPLPKTMQYKVARDYALRRT